MDDPTEYIGYDDYWDDPNFDPPCSCWCECCGCHGECDIYEDEEED